MVNDDLEDRLSDVETAVGDGDVVPFAYRQSGSGRLVDLKTGRPVGTRSVIFVLSAAVVDNWTDSAPAGGGGGQDG